MRVQASHGVVGSAQHTYVKLCDKDFRLMAGAGHIGTAVYSGEGVN